MQEIKDDWLYQVFLLTWNEVLDILYEIHPKLAHLLQENHEQLKELPFFMVNYPFAEKIIYNRDVLLPLVNGGGISVNDPSLPEIIRENLGYAKGYDNPVGMLLNKESEFYLPVDDRIVSYPVISAGQIFGFAHIVDAVMNNAKGKKASVSLWNLDAGARTAFILPKVSENGSHTNLIRTYGINIEKPNGYTDQNKIFSALNASIDKPWIQSILYFSKQFLNKLKNNQLSPIYQEMANIHRSGYTIWHNTYAKWDSDINYIFQKAKVNNLSAYAVNIVKHIYLIVAGGIPGFAPTIDECMLPKKLIENAYTDSDGYGLTEYWPILMQPRQFDTTGQPVYYSLSLPTLISYNPETFKGKTSIALLIEVATILCKCQGYILNKFEDRESHLYETAVKAKFSFYHDDPNPEKNGNMIKNSMLLPKEDSRFYKKDWAFPARCQFVRGCVKIEPINT